MSGTGRSSRSPLASRRRPSRIAASSARASGRSRIRSRSEEHTSELQSQSNLVCRLLLEKKNTEQSVRFQTALASIKLIQASAVLDLTEDDFDFLTSNKVWIATDRSRARRCVEACVYGTLDFVGYPRFPAPVEFFFFKIAYYLQPLHFHPPCLLTE